VWTLAITAVLAFLVPDCPALADPAEPAGGREIWAGADISSNVWLAYTGVTWAPWSGIHDDGLRFRTTGGYGQYRYSGNVAGPNPGDVRATEFHATTYYSDLLIGYQKRFGELTAKAFVGASIVSHDISPVDEETVVIGAETGVKGVVELWLNMGERGWGSLDLSWNTAYDTRTARARVGYRFWPKLSLGLEGGINVDDQADCRMEKSGAPGCRTPNDDTIEPSDLMDYARAGAFARYEWERGELSLSAGALGDSFSRDGATDISPYVTVNWLTQF
jgi:hypothetical protein